MEPFHEGYDGYYNFLLYDKLSPDGKLRLDLYGNVHYAQTAVIQHGPKLKELILFGYGCLGPMYFNEFFSTVQATTKLVRLFIDFDLYQHLKYVGMPSSVLTTLLETTPSLTHLTLKAVLLEGSRKQLDRFEFALSKKDLIVADFTSVVTEGATILCVNAGRSTHVAIGGRDYDEFEAMNSTIEPTLLQLATSSVLVKLDLRFQIMWGIGPIVLKFLTVNTSLKWFRVAVPSYEDAFCVLKGSTELEQLGIQLVSVTADEEKDAEILMKAEQLTRCNASMKQLDLSRYAHEPLERPMVNLYSVTLQHWLNINRKDEISDMKMFCTFAFWHFKDHPHDVCNAKYEGKDETVLPLFWMNKTNTGTAATADGYIRVLMEHGDWQVLPKGLNDKRLNNKRKRASECLQNTIGKDSDDGYGKEARLPKCVHSKRRFIDYVDDGAGGVAPVEDASDGSKEDSSSGDDADVVMKAVAGDEEGGDGGEKSSVM